ncbi:MAG: type II secretion system protein GspM [Desulfohalobiaceae bacterium]
MLNRIRDKLGILLAWQSKSQAEQKRIAYFVLLASILLPLLIWSWIDSAISQTQSEVDQLISRFEKARPLAEAVIAQKSSPSSDQLEVSALAAAQRLTKQTDLEAKLASIRPSRDQAAQDGVQLYLQNLNLHELLNFFSSLQQGSGLHMLSCDLSRGMDNPKRMDAKLILSR